MPSETVDLSSMSPLSQSENQERPEISLPSPVPESSKTQDLNESDAFPPGFGGQDFSASFTVDPDRNGQTIVSIGPRMASDDPPGFGGQVFLEENATHGNPEERAAFSELTGFGANPENPLQRRWTETLAEMQVDSSSDDLSENDRIGGSRILEVVPLEQVSPSPATEIEEGTGYGLERVEEASPKAGQSPNDEGDVSRDPGNVSGYEASLDLQGSSTVNEEPAPSPDLVSDLPEGQEISESRDEGLASPSSVTVKQEVPLETQKPQHVESPVNITESRKRFIAQADFSHLKILSPVQNSNTTLESFSKQVVSQREQVAKSFSSFSERFNKDLSEFTREFESQRRLLEDKCEALFLQLECYAVALQSRPQTIHQVSACPLDSLIEDRQALLDLLASKDPESYFDKNGPFAQLSLISFLHVLCEIGNSPKLRKIAQKWVNAGMCFLDTEELYQVGARGSFEELLKALTGTFREDDSLDGKKFGRLVRSFEKTSG
jgi:hypothetical protein